MPIYEYRCNDCQQIFEEWQKNFDQKDMSCPVCGGSGKRLLSNTSFILKGSGWYVTDYCNKNGKASTNGGTDKAKEPSAKSSESSTKESSTKETTTSKPSSSTSTTGT